jgi:hypothetical protein
MLAGSSEDLLDGDTEKSDSVDLSKVARGFFVGVAGNVKVVTLAGTTITFAVAKDKDYPLAITRLWSTGTTATGIYLYAN